MSVNFREIDGEIKKISTGIMIIERKIQKYQYNS